MVRGPPTWKQADKAFPFMEKNGLTAPDSDSIPVFTVFFSITDVEMKGFQL